jgi:hypothetical protein
MTTEQILLAILSSSFLSALLGAFIAGQYTLRAKHHDYIHHYYKMVLERRIAAYEQLDKLIGSIKIAVLDKDNRPYHWILSNEEDWVNSYKILFDTMSHGLWLSNDLFKELRDLNLLLLDRNETEESVIEFGKKNHKMIAIMREKIEHIRAIDMLHLYDVEGFLKNKKNAVNG